MKTALAPELQFSEAADQWLDSRILLDTNHRARYIAPGTIKSYREYIRSLNRFFAPIPLNKIGIGQIREYQLRRAAGELGPHAREIIERFAKQRKCTVDQLRTMSDAWKQALAKVAASHRPVNPNKINQEIGTLICVLKRAGLWTEQMKDCYEGLQRNEADIRRALSMEEQDRLLSTAASRKEWEVVYWYVILALRTTASNVELRNLRLGDINLSSGVIQIRPQTAKNRYRVRTIPLTPDAAWAIQQLIERARGLGSTEPQHFLFPFGERRNVYDPSKPMGNSGIKRAWEALRHAAGVPCTRLHDLRHTAITRLAEAGVPIPVIMSMAGHVERRMMDHYTQVSQQAQRMAVEAAYRGMRYQQSVPRIPMQGAPSIEPGRVGKQGTSGLDHGKNIRKRA